ncbi:MAG: hypothetical protein LJE85_06125 [Gammaproteobacteria bacterium]|nr:hypothetical protein [Gammaproteobacteria bacterium]
MRDKLAILCFSGLMVLATACGGSGDSSDGGGVSGPSYSGATSQAAIDENNAQTLALAATDASDTADNQEQLGVLFEEVFTHLSNQKSGISASAVVSGNCGGSASYPDNVDQQSNPITGTVSFSNFCLDGGESGPLVVSGQISFIAQVENNELVSMAVEIDNMVISYNGNTVTINSTIAFSQNGVLFETSTDFTGSQGQTLRVENLVISGDTLNGINITSGRIYHPDNGYVDISTTETLVFQNCLNGKPSSGTVLLEGSGGTTAELVFTGCGSYEICLNGNVTCTPYTWE